MKVSKLKSKETGSLVVNLLYMSKFMGISDWEQPGIAKA